MKKVIAAAVIAVIFALSFCACSETETFKASGFGSYISVGDYENITVDKNSEEYKDYYHKMHLKYVARSSSYDRVDDGKVEYGDVANIDYIGAIDGSPFDGGNDTGFDLTIGSGRFIDGFEDGLIGTKVGDKAELHLKFPSDYSNADVAGKDVVFQVKVNFRRVPKKAEDCYEKIGYKTLEEYVAQLDKECIENFATKKFLECCKFKSEPDVKNFKAIVILNYYDALCEETYGKDVKTYLEGNNSDLNSFTESIVNNLSEKPFDTNQEMKAVRDALLGYYALCDKENLKCPEKELKGTEGYERCFKESVVLKEKALKYLYENVKVIERK